VARAAARRAGVKRVPPGGVKKLNRNAYRDKPTGIIIPVKKSL
jgi:hypothetical protein